MVDRKATRLGDKTTGQMAKGIVYIDWYIFIPAIDSSTSGRCIWVPILQLSVRTFRTGSRSRWSPLRENTENLWAPNQ